MKIVFICTGNTCRSPMAEGYLKSLKLPGITVLSRGLAANGEGISKNAAAVMEEAGIDTLNHVSKTLCAEDTDADMFICMTKRHAEVLLSAGAPREKVFVMPREIPDPFGGDVSVYRRCRDAIFAAIDEMLFCGAILPITVSAAEFSDAARIAELEIQTSSAPWSAKAITDSMSANTLFFKAVCGRELIGYIGLSIAADEGYITNIAVFKEHRSKGTGTLLMLKALGTARERRLAFVSLEVRPSNEAAINLYSKLGFKNEGLRRNFYTAPKEDALIMTRRFKDDNTGY